jgi:Glyoxalase-like domain
MAHYSRISVVVIDVPADGHDRELDFWGAATGRALEPFDYPEYHGGALPGGNLWLLVQRLDEGAPRVHLDIHTDDLDAEVTRLERLGAERVQQVRGWWVMRDPAGLPFCVVEDEPGSLDETSAQRWD